MKTQLIPVLLLLLAVLAAPGCRLFRSGPEKQFPAGHPPGYAELEAGPGERTPLPPEEEAEPARTRRVTVPSDAQERDGLYMSIRPESETVAAGNPVRFSLTVRNTTSTPIPILYPTEKRFDVAIFADRQQNELVHLWSSDRMFAQVLQDIPLGGGSNVTRTIEVATTRSRDAEEMLAGDPSRPLPPGTYWAWGTHEGTPFLAAGPVEIEVLHPDDMPEAPVEVEAPDDDPVIEALD